MLFQLNTEKNWVVMACVAALLAVCRCACFADNSNEASTTTDKQASFEHTSDAASSAVIVDEKALIKLRQMCDDAEKEYRHGDKELAAKKWKLNLEAFDKLPESPKTAIAICGFAEHFSGAGVDNEKLELLLLRALRISDEQLGKSFADITMRILLELARLAAAKKDWSQAEQLLQRAIKEGEQGIGYKNDRLVPVLKVYQQTLVSQKKFKQAEDVARRILGIYEAELESANLGVSSSRDSLADFLSQHGKISEAEAPYRAAIKEYNKSMGAESILVASNMDSLAEILFRENKFDESAKLFSQSLNIKEKLLGNSSQFLLVTLEGYAKVLQKQDKGELAQRMLDRAREIKASLR